MKQLTLFLTLLIIGIGCTSSGTFLEPTVTKEYDEFKDYTVIKAEKSRVFNSMRGHVIDMTAFSISDGKEIKTPEIYSISFDSFSDGWRFLDVYELNLIIDGERITFDEDEIQASRDVISGGRVMEYLTITVKKDLFKKLALATKVKGRLGIYDLNLDYGRRTILKLLAHETKLVTNKEIAIASRKHSDQSN